MKIVWKSTEETLTGKTSRLDGMATEHLRCEGCECVERLVG